MKFNYAQTEDPPAPFISVTLSHDIHDERMVGINAKLDTGADITAIPSKVVEQLNLRHSGEMAFEDFDGHLFHKNIYAVHIKLPTGQHGKINVLTIPSDHVLLGRDVINQFRLLLDGPALTLEILESPSSNSY